MTTSENPTAADYQGSKASDIATAARNTVKLGLSLLATWGLALVVRIQLPRHLGPVAFGNYNFADSFAAAFFVFVGFGLETYVQKEVSVRPEHASDFFAGATIVRTVCGAALIAVMAAVLVATQRPPHLLQLVLMFAACQYLIAFGNLLSSMLRASASVGILAGVNVASKLVWAAGIAGGIAYGVPLVWLAVPAVVAELLRDVVLWRAARSAVGLRWRVDRQETRRVLGASLPYFAHAVALTLLNKLDITMLGFVAPGAEVGWYSAASNLATLAMFLTPVLGWILMPLLARAKHRSHEEFFSILRRALEACLVITVPVTLLIALASELLVRVAFGASFMPAARSLQILAPMLVATYACILLTTGLVLLDRPWLVTVISLSSLLVQPVVMLGAARWLAGTGPGGTAVAAALGVLGMELFQLVLFLWFLGRLALDRRSLIATGKSVLIALVVLALDLQLHPLGVARLFIDVGAYVVLALLSRVESVRDVAYVVRLLRTSKGDGQASPASSRRGEHSA